MTIALAAITTDCDDVERVARFWSGALGRPLDPGASPGFASINLARTDGGASYMFLKVGEGKQAKNHQHCDYHAADREAEVERLVGLGASRLWDKDEWGMRWTTMADPEGNEFCVADQVHAQQLG